MRSHALKNGGLGSIAARVLASLSQACHVRAPFDHWLLEDALPDATIDAIARLPVLPRRDAVFNGTREINNSARLFFSRENQKLHPVCHDVADAFRDDRVVSVLETLTTSPVSRGRLRIEYCRDVTGFWLEPHLDISVKLFTMLIYLSDEPALRDAGTDIYDASPAHKLVATVPYEKGKGLIFVPGRDTWHGFAKRPIAGVRKTLIVNFVSSEWRAEGELA